MDLNILLLRTVQYTAVITFLIFMSIVFIPKLLKSKKKLKKYIYLNNKVFNDFLILTSFYTFLFIHLFYLNTNQSNFWLYSLGFCLSMLGLIIALVGRLQLKKFWNPLTNIYNSKEILNTGVFSVIRHPIYFGRFFFSLGVMLMLSLPAVFITPLYWSYLRERLILEEKYLSEVNPKYKDHMKKVGRIIF